jgi:hypothetical protein
MSNYEELLVEYKKLKDDYDEYKKVAKEYEDELEETNKDYENRNAELLSANQKLINEISKIKEDYLQFKEKNIEKSKEIEYLETQIDKLKTCIENMKGERAINDRKIIILENENNDYLNKARELECWSEELKQKLDAALEENIILHNENEIYKAESEEAYQRLQEEFEEAKNEITSKEKIINRMTMHRDFLLKTAYNAQDDFNHKIINSNSLKSLKNSNSGANITNMPSVPNKMISLPDRFIQTYSKSFHNKEFNVNNDKDESCNLDLKDDITENEYENIIAERKQTISSEVPVDYSKSKKISVTGLEKFLNKELKGSILTSTDNNDKIENLEDDEEREFIKQRIDLEIKSILDNRKNFMLNTLTQENFSFDLVVSNKTKETSAINENSSAVINKNKLVENIDLMLARIQARKEKVMDQKRNLQMKYEKVGLKIC